MVENRGISNFWLPLIIRVGWAMTPSNLGKRTKSGSAHSLPDIICQILVPKYHYNCIYIIPELYRILVLRIWKFSAFIKTQATKIESPEDQNHMAVLNWGTFSYYWSSWSIFCSWTTACSPEQCGMECGGMTGLTKVSTPSKMLHGIRCHSGWPWHEFSLKMVSAKVTSERNCYLENLDCIF